MATQEADSRGIALRLLDSLRLSVLLVAFTAVETVALVVWLGLVESTPGARAASLGLGVLFLGLLVEHYLTDLAVNGASSPFPAGRALVFSATETALWAGWLAVAERVGGVTGIAVAGVALAVLLVPQHTIEDNVLRGGGLFDRLVDLDTLGFSVVESLGASAWLLFVFEPGLVAPLLPGGLAVDPAAVGAGLLGVSLLLEHVIATGFARRS